VIAAAYDNWVGLGLSVALVVLMAVVLIVPERF
jgi:hypothetical protein